MPKMPAMSPSDMPVSEVLDRLTGPRRQEAEQLADLMAGLTGAEPVVWAGRIAAFGCDGEWTGTARKRANEN